MRDIDDRLKYFQEMLIKNLKINSFSKVLLSKDLYNKELKDKISSNDNLSCIIFTYKIALYYVFSNKNTFYSSIMGKNCVLLLINAYDGQPSFNLLISSY